MTETRSINFETNHGNRLKDALESLSHSHPKGFGIMEINPENGFKIYVLDESDKNVIALMCLEPSKLINFRCSKPIKKMTVNVKFFLRMLQAIEEQNIVLFRDDHSSYLSFECVSSPGIVLGIGILKSNAKFEAISGTPSTTWETILPTDELTTMIPEMIKDSFTQLVTVDRTSAETKFVIGEKEWMFKSNMEASGAEGTESGQRHHVEFLCSRVDSLKKACSLASQCTFALLPSGNVMFHFCFEEGSLVFIMRPLVLTTH